MGRVTKGPRHQRVAPPESPNSRRKARRLTRGCARVQRHRLTLTSFANPDVTGLMDCCYF
eukprot:4987869-Pyramimonas_sp.AAC.1